MALSSGVDTAAEAVTKAKASLRSVETSLDKTKKQLLILLGWSADSEVEFGTLPEIDPSSLSSIDIETDIKTAVANNYSVRITRQRLSNSQSENNKITYTNTLKNQEDTITANVRNTYNSLLLTKDSYEQAKTAYELSEKEREAAELKLSAGVITKKTYEKQEAACLSAKTALETARLELLTAKLTYDWAIAGLASAS